MLKKRYFLNRLTIKMKRFKKELIFITLGVITPLSLHTLKVNAGSF